MTRGEGMLRSQSPKHHQRIDEAEPRMLERAGKPPDDLEAATPPELHRALVRAYDEIELHRRKSHRARLFERVFAHPAGHTPAARGGRGDVAAICDMPAAARLVRLQEIGAKNLAVFLQHEDRVAGGAPIGERRLAAHVARDRVGLAGAEGWLEDRPERVVVAGYGRPDRHRGEFNHAEFEGRQVWRALPRDSPIQAGNGVAAGPQVAQYRVAAGFRGCLSRVPAINNTEIRGE